ncbi:hypothetical protein [Mycobacterium marinum]|uniref:hypothetical protein n=1 Tax=Mycobacterium marinum TaxID=1781 RepID=UPI003FF123C3
MKLPGVAPPRISASSRAAVAESADNPGVSITSAVAAQRALELPAPMGIATGEAGLRDGDYVGAVLNRAARVLNPRPAPPQPSPRRRNITHRSQNLRRPSPRVPPDRS